MEIFRHQETQDEQLSHSNRDFSFLIRNPLQDQLIKQMKKRGSKFRSLVRFEEKMYL